MTDKIARDLEVFRAKMVRKHCRTRDDAEMRTLLMLLAEHFAFQAATIYEGVGGPALIAERFSAVADKARERL